MFVLLLSISLTACGGGTESSNAENGNSDSLQQDANSVDAPVQEEVDFENVIVVDNSECSIKITGIDPDNMWGYTLNVNLENKSADKTYMFSVSDAAINGVQSDPFFATEVAAGKKANADISFSDSTLEDNGITVFTDIELSFRVYDSNDWTVEAVAEETTHIYPHGADEATTFVREPQSSDEILIDNEYVTATIIGYEEEGTWGYTVNLFLQNKTDATAMFSVDEASVNGYMADPFYATSVGAGKCAFSSMSWSDTTFEENDITSVEEIEFKFRAYNGDDWTADDFANELIILNP